MTEPRLLDPDELDKIDGSTVTVLGMGMDALAFRTADDKTVIATMCLGCGGHVNYYEIDPSALSDTGDSLSSAG